jgi:peptidoglycan/xylan/chitin deacetylase (PgdA/CDA1 family)
MPHAIIVRMNDLPRGLWVRAARRIALRVTARQPRLLMYHRFSAGANPRCTSIDQLLRHVELARRTCEFTTVSHAVEARRRGLRSGRPLAALTVDDGYHDFYEVAWPALRAAGVPVTVYVVANFVEGRTWLWHDKLAYILSAAPSQTLELRLANFAGRFPLLDADSRHAAWERIADFLVEAGPERAALLDEIAASAAVKPPDRPPPDAQPMSWQQLREIAAAGNEVGSHGMEHSRMSALTEVAARAELVDSKHMIEERTGARVTGFAYPNGAPGDLSERVDAVARSCGYEYTACSFWNCQHGHRDATRLGRWPCGDEEFTLNILSGASMLKRCLTGK